MDSNSNKMTNTRRSSRTRKITDRYKPVVESIGSVEKQHLTTKHLHAKHKDEPDNYLPYNASKDKPPPLSDVDLVSDGNEPGPDADGFFDVEKIEGRRFRKNTWQFYVKFQGYSRAHNMWLPFSYLNDWGQNYVIERFTHKCTSDQLSKPTKEQQMAVDAALHYSSTKTQQRNAKEKYKDYSDSESDTKLPTSDFVDVDYCPSESENNSIFSDMDSFFLESDEVHLSKSIGSIDDGNPAMQTARNKRSKSISPPLCEGKLVSPLPKKRMKRSCSLGLQSTQKVCTFAKNKHFADLFTSYARILETATTSMTKTQEARLFRLLTEVGRVFHEEEVMWDSTINCTIDPLSCINHNVELKNPSAASHQIQNKDFFISDKSSAVTSTSSDDDMFSEGSMQSCSTELANKEDTTSREVSQLTDLNKNSQYLDRRIDLNDATYEISSADDSKSPSFLNMAVQQVEQKNIVDSGTLFDGAIQKRSYLEDLDDFSQTDCGSEGGYLTQDE
jgi:hypothetical protein